MRTFERLLKSTALATFSAAICLSGPAADAVGATRPMETAARAKLGQALARSLETGAGPQDVLVYLKARADLTQATGLRTKAARGAVVYRVLVETARQSQAPLTALLGKRGVRFQTYHIANVVAVDSARPELIAELAGRSDVARILANPSVRILPESIGSSTSDPGTRTVGDNIRRTGADRVWSEFGATGQGLVVAGQDTGIDWDHPGLIRQYRGHEAGRANHDYSWHDAIREPLNTRAANPCGYATREPCDDHGHGTHTIGTAVGDDGVGNQVGMAPGAKWIGCRNMDAGIGKPGTYLECFQYFLAPWPYGGDPAADGDPGMAPDVINNSWGCPANEGCDGTEFLEALNALKAAGIMVVAAAGNSGSACGTIADAPAHHSDEVLVVGAVDHRNDSIASFSSRGPSTYDSKTGPDLTAPGVTVRSTIPGGGYSSSWWSGTSMASPHVAGAVALLWSAVPELKGDIDATTTLLRGSSEPKTTSQTCGGVPGTAVPNNTFGHGIMNIHAAVAAARAVDGKAD